MVRCVVDSAIHMEGPNFQWTRDRAIRLHCSVIDLDMFLVKVWIKHAIAMHGFLGI